VTAGQTLSRLRRGVFKRKTRKADQNNDEKEEMTKGKLGMIEGVFFRVLTNLFGVILFLRLGWLTAYAGIGLSILVVLLSSSLTIITALSLSAICTNGKVAAGGAYYLISRALGPEFGASIGVLFYVATSVSVSLYLLGFAETVVNQIEGPVFSSDWDLRLIAFFGLIFCQMVCLIGVSYVVKVEKIMLYVLLIAVLLFIIGIFVGPKDSEHFGFVSLSSDVSNGKSDFPAVSAPQPEDLSYLNEPGLLRASQCEVSSSDILKAEYGNVDLGIALAVFFPAVTGILAGANISGDLKNPSTSIPRGTILAIFLGALTYILLVILFGSAFNRVTILEASFLRNSTVAGESANGIYSCKYGGLFHDSLLIAKASVSPGFVYFGIYAASVSSGLAALLGAPRILQALAKDRLFSTFDPLAKGYGKNDEPLRAYVVTFIIAAACILTGDINSVAPLITTFFLASYAMVNYACYSAEESKSPGWRPTFRYFDKWLAFVGAIGCVSVMLFLSAITGFITFTIGLALYKYVEVSTREGLGSASNWGPHKEASEYNTALKSALILEEQAPPKRPSSVAETKHVSLSSNDSGEGISTGARQHTEIELGMHSSIAAQRYPRSSIDLDSDDGGDVGIAPGTDDIESDYGISPKTGDIEEEDEDEILGRNGGMEHDPLYDTTHVKNFRPQCLVLAGPSSRRPALAVFVAGLRKARGVNIFGDVLVGDLSDPEVLRVRNRRASLSYVSKFGIRAFNDVIVAPSFRTGCRSLMQLGGLGRRMRVNTVVLGFLDDWETPVTQRQKNQYLVEQTSSDAIMDSDEVSPPPSVEDYVGVIGDSFDLGLGVVILRGELDLLRSEYLTQTVRSEMERLLTLGLGAQKDYFSSRHAGGQYLNANYVDADELMDAPPRFGQILAEMSAAEGSTEPVEGTSEDLENPSSQKAASDRKSAKRIDVWWLVDDGGLTIMLPHILRQAKSPPWVGCMLRVVAVGATNVEAERERHAMSKLLEKLRIPAQVSTVSLEDSESSGLEEAQVMPTRNEMENITLNNDEEDREAQIGAEDVKNLQKQLFRAYSSMDETQNKSRRSTYERMGRLIATHSSDALMVVVSLPVPPITLEPEEYMNWLDLLSKRCAPPVLMVRGSQRDVVTMFS